MDYANDPELSGKYLGTITRDFALVSDTLKEASYQVRKRGISRHPIFVFARMPVPFGSLLISPDEMATEWYVLASYLDVFVQQGLVAPEHIEDFERAYKDPDEFCCLFVVDGEFTKFVFVPFPED